MSSARVLQASLITSFALMGACAGQIDEEEGAAIADSIVGGASERGYPAVGYLTRRDLGVFCNATVVSTHAAVTAAHCVDDVVASHDLRMGFGTVGSSPAIAVKQVLLHPRYQTRPGDVWHDIAVLLLDRAAPVEAARIGTAQADDLLRVIGYGRTFNAPYESRRRYVHERKSATLKVLSFDRSEIRTIGLSGSACKGDSGTGLFLEGTDAFVGVHSRSPQELEFDCGPGIEKLATATDAEGAFISAGPRRAPAPACATQAC